MRLLLFILFALSLVGCATLSRPSAQVFVEQSGVATLGDGKPFDFAAGRSFELLSGVPALLESPGNLPVLLVPLPPETIKVSVRLRPVPAELVQSGESWKKIDSLIDEIGRVQKLLRDGKGHDAATLVDALSAKFPQLNSLQYLKASCLLVLGERDAAQAILQRLAGSADQKTSRMPASEVTAP